MKLEQLAFLVEVAKHGSLSKAAVALNRTQPFISKQIRDLEEQLGAELFHRTGHGMALSEAGERLLVRANNILEEVSTAEQEVRNLGRLQLSQAIIALPTTVGRVINARMTERIMADHPSIRLRIMEGTSGPILDWVMARKVDVAVLYDTVAVSHLMVEPLFKERMYLVTGRGGMVPLHTPLRELAKLRLILPGRSEGLRALMELAAARAGIGLDVVIEADTLGAIKQLVEAGLGYSVLPFTAVRDEVASGTLVSSLLTEPQVTRQLVITTTPVRIPASGLNELVRLIKAVVAESPLAEGGWHASS